VKSSLLSHEESVDAKMALLAELPDYSAVVRLARALEPAYLALRWRWFGVGVPDAREITKTIQDLRLSGSSIIETGGLCVRDRAGKRELWADKRLLAEMDLAVKREP